MPSHQDLNDPSSVVEAAPDGLPYPRRALAAGAVWLTVTMSVLDTSMVSVALPTITAEFGTTPSAAIWIVNAYHLTIAMLLILFSNIGDRIGYRRVYLPGLLIFVLGSALSATASSLSALITARVLQGIGSAAVMSMNAALIRGIYPFSMLGRSLGYNALIIAVSAAAGPSLGALILSAASWPWLFAINLPIGVIALIVAARALPDPVGHPRPLNLISACLSAVAFGALILGAGEIGRSQFISGAGLLLTSGVAWFVLISRERTEPNPFFPLDLLRRPIFSLSLATSVTAFAAQGLAYVTLPFFLQNQMGGSVVEIGLLLSAWPAAIACIAPIAGCLADRHSAGLLGGLGLSALVAGLTSLALMGEYGGGADVAWRLALCGLGFGLFQSPNNRTLISAAPRHRSGAAGGALASARVLGQAIGALVATTGFFWAGIEASQLLFGLAAGLAVLAAFLSLTRNLELVAGRHGDAPDGIRIGAQEAE